MSLLHSTIDDLTIENVILHINEHVGWELIEVSSAWQLSRQALDYLASRDEIFDLLYRDDWTFCILGSYQDVDWECAHPEDAILRAFLEWLERGEVA